MIGYIRQLSAIFFELMRILFDFSTKFVERIVQNLGPQGYYFYGVLANTFYFFGSFGVKMFPQVDWSIVMIARGLCTFIGAQIIGYTYNKPLYYEGNELIFVTIRNFLMAINQFIFYYALLVIPINITWVINNTGPLFVFILAYFILGTSMTQKDVFYIFISILGVSMITSPQLLLQVISYIIPINDEDLKNEMNAYQIFVSFIWLGGVCLWGLGIVSARLCKTTSLSVNNNMGIQFTALGSLMYFYRSDTISVPSFQELFFIIIFHCIPVFLSQILFIHGTMVAEDQGKYSLTSYIPVFYSYAIQILFNGRNPKLIEFGGIALSFYGLYKILVKPKPQNQDQIKQRLIQKGDQENQKQDNNDNKQNNAQNEDNQIFKQKENFNQYELQDLRKENSQTIK